MTRLVIFDLGRHAARYDRRFGGEYQLCAAPERLSRARARGVPLFRRQRRRQTDRARAARSGKERAERRKARRDFVEYYTEHSADLTKPYPGIRETVSELGRRGIVRAVASNKYQAATEKLVAHFFGEETFRVVLGQREGIAPKPDPTIVRDILSRTGFAPAETLYVGDSCVDMQTARNGGLRSVGVSWGFRPRAELEQNGATFVIDCPAQLLDLL